MSEPVSIVLSGIGGYGEVYLAALLDEEPGAPFRTAGTDDTHIPFRIFGAADPQIPFRIAGVADPEPERCSRLGELKARGVPVFSSLEKFYAHHASDLAVVSSPTQFHAPQTCLALARGSHVLLEKPAAATVEEVDDMIRARDEAGRFVAVGYQWSFSSPIRALKRDILSGAFGRALKGKTLCLWPRDEAYYRRNDWAGRLRDKEGRWILDSPANNAMAHFLHNLLYLLGEEEGRSAEPAELTAELYRANAIESFDTAALKVKTKAGAELLFLASHAVPENRDPVFEQEFENARVVYPGGASPITASFRDGTSKTYPHPDSEAQTLKLWTCLRAAAGGGSGNGTSSGGGADRGGLAGDAVEGGSTPPGDMAGAYTIPCGLEAARPHTRCIAAAHESMPEPAPFPHALLRVSGPPDNRLHWVDGLAEDLEDCYRKSIVPGEAGYTWARAGAKTNLPE